MIKKLFVDNNFGVNAGPRLNRSGQVSPQRVRYASR